MPLYVDSTIVEQPVDHRTLHARYADAGVAYMGEAVAQQKPFLLYVAFSHLHTPIIYDATVHNTSRRGHYGNAVRELDNTVARLVTALDDLSVANSTLVLFTGDNGGGDTQCEFGGNNAPFVGEWQREHGGGGTTGKTTTWEGGHREPGLAVWPGTSPPPPPPTLSSRNSTSCRRSRCSAAPPLPPSKVFDGVDIAPLLFGQRGAARAFRLRACSPTRTRARGRPARWTPSASGGTRPSGGRAASPPSAQHSARAARRALLEHDPPLVFNLYADPAERVALQTDVRHIRLGGEDAPRAARC